MTNETGRTKIVVHVIDVTTLCNSAAIVLGASTNGLGVIRSLGREGIRVIGVDSNPHAPGLASRFCEPLLARDPSVDPQALLKSLMDLGSKLSFKGVLYPTSDAYVLFASRFREQLSRYFLFAIPSEEVLECIVNKRKLYELAESLGVSYPATHFPGTIEEVVAIKDEIEFPAFIKPYYSHLWRKAFRNKGFIVDNPIQLVKVFTEVFPLGSKPWCRRLSSDLLRT